MVRVGVAAATDVTGYGLVGHLLQMLGDEVSAEVDPDAVPVLEEALELARAGIVPGGSRRNEEATWSRVRTTGLDDAERIVLFDAQTSGGLLMAVERDLTGSLLASLKEAGVQRAAKIGRLIPGDGTIEVRRA